MNFKIWHKLAILLIATTTLTLVIGIGLSQRSFKSGFMDYLQRQEQRRLEGVANNLLQAYVESGNWDFIRGNNQLWFFMIRPRPGRFAPVEGRHMRNRSRGEFFPEHDRGPFPHMRGGRRLPKMVLLDENKSLIVGKRKMKGPTQYYPIKQDQQIIAYIESEKPVQITDRLDKMFAAQQNQAFIINTVVSLIVSVLVALLASYYFRRRIRDLNQIAHQLTSGKYEQRVRIKQKDELGQLGDDFNILAETLQKNQRSQQQWIADISHELRTPVAILKGELEALDDGIRPLDNSAIQSLQQEIERLNKLIEDLYQLSVSDMGALKYEKTEFDICGLFTELKDGFKDRFEKQNIRFEGLQNSQNPILFYADKQRLFQLLSNLLENSLRYTDAGGEVRLSCQNSEDSLTIIVEDSAPGIPEQKINQVFDRLFRLDSSRTRANGGAGLGLAIAKQIVLAHRGEIVAAASDLGGVRISCRLPKYKVEHEH